MKKKLLFLLVLISLLALVIAGCGGGDDDTTDTTDDGGDTQETEQTDDDSDDGEDAAAGEVTLPDEITISTYDVGSSGHTQLSAISDVFAKAYGTQIRMMPSASGAGRLTPLKDGKADNGGRLGDEVYFAFEGIEEYATQQWGPQDVTYIYPILNHFGFLVMEDSDIESVADLEGKKIPQVIGNSSVNIKMEAMLALAGLTLDDVEVVETASYADQPTAMAQGQFDASGIVPSAATVAEADELHGVRWISLDEMYDDEALERMREVYPFATPDDWDLGGALTEGEPVTFLGYTTYAPAVYRDADPDLVYNWLRALDEQYDVYSQASADMVVWDVEMSVPEPLGVPLHEGAIRFFEEKGMWTEEYQQKNDELIERQQKLQEAWETVVDEASEQGLSEAEFSEYWLERKAELVD